MIYRILLTVVCAPCLWLSAAEEVVIPLAKTWEFRLDKTEVGVAEKWQNMAVASPGWGAISVPGTWESQGHNFNGLAWYRTQFTVPAGTVGPLWIELPAIDETDTTWLNGKRIGATKGAFQDPRRYRVDSGVYTIEAENTLVIQVEDRYGDGGLSEGVARVLIPGNGQAFSAKHSGPSQVDLPLIKATNDAEIIKEWPSGWRDEGTADTRMRVAVKKDGPNGTTVMSLDAWFPTAAGEFVQRHLPPGSDGRAWQTEGRDYLQFWYRSTTSGDLQVRLTEGVYTWRRGGPGHVAGVTLQKSAEWIKVVIPFSWFLREHADRRNDPLVSTAKVTELNIGYRNNELQEPGRIDITGFSVGRFAASEPVIALDMPWRAQRDPEDGGVAAGWAGMQCDDTSWDWHVPGEVCERISQAWEKYDGVLWLRRTITVPEGWQGRGLLLDCGTIRDERDEAQIFVDGKQVAATSERNLHLTTLLPMGLTPGRHQLAIRYRDGWGTAGLVPGVSALAPASFTCALRAGEGAWQPLDGAQPGPYPASTYAVRIRPEVPAMATMHYEIRDVFHRILARGTTPTSQADVVLRGLAAKRLHASEALNVRCMVDDVQGVPLAAWQMNEVALDMSDRDQVRLTALAEKTVETSVYGSIRLVDRIDCAVQAEAGPHPYKQGGIRKSWVGRRAYSTWEDGITTQDWLGKKFRAASNNEWFGYRIGRGLTPHKPYLLRVIVPEDRPRYCVMNIQAGRNYQGTGYHSGIRPGDPFSPYPLSGKYSTYDHIVVPDDRTYGATGARTVDGSLGMWVFFYDIGRCYAAGYEGGGPAVAEMRLYELEDAALAGPVIAYPTGQPMRTMMADWEREPENPPADVVASAKFLGLNAISPAFLKWGRLCYWKTSLDYQQTTTTWDDVRVVRPPDEVPIYDRWLEATRGSGLRLIPRVEVGGAESIPLEQRAIGADGLPARPNRFHSWCADLTQPATLSEWNRVIDETIADRLKENPQLGGLLWRIRSDRMPISYSQFAVKRFIMETAVKNPPVFADDKAAAHWAASAPVKDAYEAWWHTVRRDFQKTLAERLTKLRPDLHLWYYNWDPDGWELGKVRNNADDWRDYYSRLDSQKWYARRCASQTAIPAEDYVKMLLSGSGFEGYGNKPHHALRMDLYAAAPDVTVLGPLWNWFLLDNEPYQQVFSAPAGAGFSIQTHYEEKGRQNVQNDNYESSELTPGGPDFAMANEVMACFHADPTTLTFTTYTFGRGFVDRHREFARHYLALPGVAGLLVPQKDIFDVRVRRYPAMATESRLSVVHRGFTAVPGCTIGLPWVGSAPGMIEDATGKAIAWEMRENELRLTLDLAPMSLCTVRVKMGKK